MILNQLLNIQIIIDSGRRNQESANNIKDIEKALTTWK